ncbi:MAG TPA: hypothetical protein VHN79_14765 [Lacunisphaera sp.]|nr:hypothetical protein [Lacunisphaera sp.]
MWHRLIRLLLLCGFAAALHGAEWKLTTWNGEPAYASASEGWRAVVSVTRARLMHFGPADSEVNLLLAPAARDNPNRLGGHRLWFGPQAEWSAGWPPPDAWEYREPLSHRTEAGVLRLLMVPTNDDWPQLTRTYHWAGATLVCGAESSGGRRPAQFVQIVQLDARVVSSATVRPETGFPAGYVRLASTAGPFTARFVPPAQGSLAGDVLTLRHTGAVGKFGFRPQPLSAVLNGCELIVARGVSSGRVRGDPDEGFHSQIYLSGPDGAFVELEQLSPLFAPGEPARFEMLLSGRKR